MRPGSRDEDCHNPHKPVTDQAKVINTLRTGSFKLFKLFKRPFPGFLTSLTL